MNGYRVAIVGATGLVGQEFIRVLEQRNFPVNTIQMFASDRSAGKKVRFAGKEYVVQETAENSFKEVDIALFSAGADISRRYSPFAARAGAVVIDNSAAFRQEDDVPLVVPEVNPEDLKWHHGIIANPNCSTIQMVVALFPIQKVNPIQRIVVTTFQSVSGTGSAAIDELTTQSKQLLAGEAVAPHVYPHQIGFNVLPHIDVFLENDYTNEEMKMVRETRKIMHAPDVLVSATCARVPVYVGHSEAVSIEMARPMSGDECRGILAKAPGVQVMDAPDINLYPTAAMSAGSDVTFVGRIRADISHPNGLLMWVVADNVRKGAATNAVQIAEVLIERGWLKPEEKREKTTRTR